MLDIADLALMLALIEVERLSNRALETGRHTEANVAYAHPKN